MRTDILFWGEAATERNYIPKTRRVYRSIIVQSINRKIRDPAISTYITVMEALGFFHSHKLEGERKRGRGGGEDESECCERECARVKLTR